MKLLYHNEAFESKMLESLIQSINDSKKEEKIEIYLFSKGGKCSIESAMTHIINSNPEKFKIIGYEYLASAAFNLFVKAKCEKELLDGTIGMYHLAVISLDYNDRLKTVYGIDDAYIKKMKTIDQPGNMEFMKSCGFTKKEIKKANDGQDLFFQVSRMNQIIENYSKNEK